MRLANDIKRQINELCQIGAVNCRIGVIEPSNMTKYSSSSCLYNKINMAK